jgi:hypothetical protein
VSPHVYLEHHAQRLLFTRAVLLPGSPTIESWARVVSTGGDGTALTDLVAWAMTMPLGNVRWLGGLRGDSASGDGAVEDAFVFAEHDFEPGEHLDLAAEGRSSEEFVPFFLVDDGRDEFFGGLMWSDAWRASLERADDRLRVAVSFPGVGTAVTPARPFELPHAFFGVAAKSTTDETGALRQFVLQGIRHGQPFQPLVTYNTWFVYGTRINAKTRWWLRSIGQLRSASSCSSWTPAAHRRGETDDFDFDSVSAPDRGFGSLSIRVGKPR